MICSICGGDKFKGLNDRPFRVCLTCEAMERHRFLASFIKNNFINISSVLEIAPLNKKVYGTWLRDNYNCKYTCTDKWKTGNPVDRRDVSFVDHCVGMEDLKDYFKEEKFDLVIFQHVLEEIPNYKDALLNIKSILNEDGSALMEIPIKNKVEHVRKQIDSFGNVWNFGLQNMTDDLSNIFSKVSFHQVVTDNFRSDLFWVKV